MSFKHEYLDISEPLQKTLACIRLCEECGHCKSNADITHNSILQS